MREPQTDTTVTPYVGGAQALRDHQDAIDDGMQPLDPALGDDGVIFNGMRTLGSIPLRRRRVRVYLGSNSRGTLRPKSLGPRRTHSHSNRRTTHMEGLIWSYYGCNGRNLARAFLKGKSLGTLLEYGGRCARRGNRRLVPVWSLPSRQDSKKNSIRGGQATNRFC